MAQSASISPYGDRNEGRFHQAATAVVVIIGVGGKPKDNADQNAKSAQKGELQHRQPKVDQILIRLLAFRHLPLNINVGMERLV